MQLIGWYVDGIQPDSCQSILLLFSYDYNNKYILLQLYLILRMSDMFLHNTFLASLSRKIFFFKVLFILVMMFYVCTLDLTVFINITVFFVNFSFRASSLRTFFLNTFFLSFCVIYPFP